jgi:hypothetical protein
MSHWTSFVLPFALGFAAGTAICFILLASKIRFYRKFIEQRLDAINRTISAQASAREPSKPDAGKSPWPRPGHSREGPNPLDNS